MSRNGMSKIWNEQELEQARLGISRKWNEQKMK